MIEVRDFSFSVSVVNPQEEARSILHAEMQHLVSRGGYTVVSVVFIGRQRTDTAFQNFGDSFRAKLPAPQMVYEYQFFLDR